MLRQGAPARDFESAAEMQAHYRALQARTWAPRAVRPRPEDGRTRALAEAQRERERLEAAEREAAMLEDRAQVLALAAQVLTPEHLARDPRHILTGVAAAFGFTSADIVGPCQLVPFVRARWAAIAAVHEARPELSLARLGRIFGDRDHTSIRHALRKMAVEGVPQPPTQDEPA